MNDKQIDDVKEGYSYRLVPDNLVAFNKFRRMCHDNLQPYSRVLNDLIDKYVKESETIEKSNN